MAEPLGKWHLMRTRPYQHQLDALAKAQGRAAFGFLMEMGTGKSKTDIDETCDLHLSGLVDQWLIVAGKGSYANWVDAELPAHTWESVATRVHLWRGGGTATEQRALRQLHAPAEGRLLRVLVMNVEGLSQSRTAQRAALDFVMSSARTKITMDESTLIKNHESTRCRAMCGLARKAAYRRILTGSPVTRDPMDLWGQFLFLGEGLLGWRSFHAWRAHYAVMVGMDLGGRTVQKPVSFRNTEDLAMRVAAHSHRVLKDDCLDLPPKIYSFRDVPATPEQQRHYDTMRRVALAELDAADAAGEGALATARTAMAAVSKMHQIMCGHLRDDDGVVHELPSRRLDALEDVLEESGDCPTIVWCYYNRDVELVAARLAARRGAGNVRTYYGPTPLPARQAAVRDFEEGRADYFVASLSTASRGLTLVRARAAVYYSNCFDLELRLQSEDRCHRIGQHHPVSYVDLRVPGTVDDRIVRSLRAKIDVAAAVTGDTAREWLV